jgi:hypothetical protein
MLKVLEVLLKIILSVLIIGFMLTFVSLWVNECEIALAIASVTAYTCLPLLFIAVAIDVKIN